MKITKLWTRGNATRFVNLTILAASLGWAIAGQAATYTWTGGTSTNWNNSANWSPNTGYPSTTNDTALFSGSLTANQPALTANVAVSNLTFASSGWQLSCGTAFVLTNMAINCPAINCTNTIGCQVTPLQGATRTWTATNNSTLVLTPKGGVIFASPGGSTSVNWGDATHPGTLLLVGSITSGNNVTVVVNGGSLVVSNSGTTGYIATKGATINSGSYFVQQLLSPQLYYNPNNNGAGTLNGGVFNLNGFNDLLYSLTLGGGTLRNSGGTFTLPAVAAGNTMANFILSTTTNVIFGDPSDAGVMTLTAAASTPTNGLFWLSGAAQRKLIVNSAVNLNLPVVNTNNLAGLTISGPGPLTLNGANAFGGLTTNNGSAFVLGSATALGTSSLVANGGTIGVANGSWVFTNAVSLGSNTVFDTTGGNLAFTPAIGGAGGLVVSNAYGNGSLTLVGANTYKGPTAVVGGTLTVSTSAQTTNSYIVNDNCALYVINAGAGTSIKPTALTLGSSVGVTLTLDLTNKPNPSVALLNVTNGSGLLSVPAPVTLNLDGADGGAFLTVGQFPLIKYKSLSGSAANFTLNNNLSLIQGYLSNNVANNSLDCVITGKTVTVWMGNVSGNWDTTTANWTLSGAATTYSDNSAVSFGDGALNKAVNLSPNPVYPAVVTVNNTAAYSFGGAGMGAGAFVKQGAGMVVLDCANNFSSVEIDAGWLQVGVGDATPSLGSGNILNNGNLAFNLSSANYVFGAVSGSGLMVQAGTGQTIFYGDLSGYSGSLTVSNGTLQLSSTAANSGPASAITLAGGALVYDPGTPISLANAITLTGNASLGITSGNTASFVGSLSGGSKMLTMTGPGTFFLNPSSTTLGAISVTGGVLGTANGALGGSGTPITVANGAAFWVSSSATAPNSLTLGGGSGPDGNGVLQQTDSGNSTLSGAVTLSADSTVNVVGGNLTLSGLVSGPGGLIENGNGILSLTGADTYTGNTTVNAGTLALTSAFNATGAVSVNDNCGLNVSLSGPAASLRLASLTLGYTMLQFNNLSSSTVAALTATNLTVNNTVTIPFNSSPNLAPGQYPLIKYAGSIGGSGFSGFVLNYSRKFGVATLVDNTANSSVDLLITSTNTIPDVWTAAVTTNWDISTLNWKTNGVVMAFANGDPVQFDDTATGANATNVNISAAVTTYGVVVNNTNLTYSLYGNAIGGSGAVVKQGPGTLVMQTTSKNTFSGGVSVTGGMLKAGNGNQVFGTYSNVVQISNGGTVDFNNQNYQAQGQFLISGAGVGGLGALVNNAGTSFGQPCANVALAGDATVGGTTRWDMAGSSGTSLDLRGHTLTCVGNQFSVFNGKITAGNINVSAGTLCLRQSTVWTNAGSQITLGQGTSLWAPNNGGQLNITVPIYANGAYISPNNMTTDDGADYNSPIILGANTTNTLAAGTAANTVRQWAPISGVGTFLVGGAGPVFLFATNTYTASTIVTNGTLVLTNTGSINNTPQISLWGGGTLDVSGLASGTYNLSASTALEAEGAGGTNMAVINGAVGGTVNLGSRPISLAYDGTDPALIVSNATLQLNGNAFTVNGAALANGTYVIAQQANGSISSSGSYPAVTGSAIGAGQTGSITVSGGNVNLVVSSTPSVPPGFPANAVSLNRGTASLTVTGVVGAPFSLWATTNLALSPITNTWMKLTNGTVSASPFTITDPGATTNQQRFYIFSSP